MKKLATKHICFLWFIDFYDVILSGICTYEGKPHYFKIVDEIDPVSTYKMIPLTIEEYKVFLEIHRAFSKYVTPHSRLQGFGKLERTYEPYVPTGEETKFYLSKDISLLKLKRKEYENREPVAIFKRV